VRIWTLKPDDKKQPCAGILEGDGHRDTIQSVVQIATLFIYGSKADIEGMAFYREVFTVWRHRSADNSSMSSSQYFNVILTFHQWVLPEFPDENTGTDKPTRIFYPHFSTTQVHMYIVDWHVSYS